MNHLTAAHCLSNQGRYADALENLQHSVPRRERVDGEILRVELLERVGQVDSAKALVESLCKLRGLTGAQRGRCAFVLSRLSSQDGDHDKELQYLQQTLLLAKEAHDLEQACWAQLRLLNVIADREGPESARGLMSSLRRDVTQLGVPSVTAALHLFTSILAGKRGQVANALQHTRIAKQILSGHPHAWLETWTCINEIALSLLVGDLKFALSHSDHVMALATCCGAPFLVAGVWANLGNVFLAHGDFDRATEHLGRAADLLPRTGENAATVQDSLARAYLAKGDLDACTRILASLELPTHTNNAPHAYRYAQLTKIDLLTRLGQNREALILTNRSIELARKSADDYLTSKLTLIKGGLLARQGDPTGMTAAVDLLGQNLPTQPIELYAQYEAAVGIASEHERSSFHLARADRAFKWFEHRSARLQVVNEDLGSTSPCVAVSECIQAIAALFMFAGRPELVCHELAQVLRASATVDAAQAVRRRDDGSTETTLFFDDGDAERTPLQAISVSDGIDFMVRPKADIESHATLAATRMLLSNVRDLERARSERQERQALWPIDELPAEDDSAVVLGKMRDLMISARKVARINVAVLITGESGTGKEVLARAIHLASGRADKPFVPLNCTAVPRELLESQLFGHRRGAFTGAERDSLGMIRAARDGTLFLDEIGELGLDLQPKLLRFLESGEIAPLGEPSPLRVSVRVIAATNANLEALVHAGRFRADLFYRLNVIRLSIPPLRERRDEIPALVHHLAAQAASEFGKRRVRISEDAMEHLILYGWPGNVRELQNELRRIVALAEPDAVLDAAVLSPRILGAAAPPPRTDGSEMVVSLHQKLNDSIAQIEREMIQAALRTHDGRLEAAARALGISRKGLYLKRQRLGL